MVSCSAALDGGRPGMLICIGHGHAALRAPRVHCLVNRMNPGTPVIPWPLQASTVRGKTQRSVVEHSTLSCSLGDQQTTSRMSCPWRIHILFVNVGDLEPRSPTNYFANTAV